MEPQDEVLEKVLSTFFGPPRKRPRRKPHRCLGCGKVTKHIFCKETYAECAALHRERQRGEGS